MSIETVSEYKENKRNRHKNIKKEKRAGILRKIVCVAILAAVGLWCVYCVHGAYINSHADDSAYDTNGVFSASNAVVTDSAGNTYSLVQTSSGGYALQTNTETGATGTEITDTDAGVETSSDASDTNTLNTLTEDSSNE